MLIAGLFHTMFSPSTAVENMGVVTQTPPRPYDVVMVFSLGEAISLGPYDVVRLPRSFVPLVYHSIVILTPLLHQPAKFPGLNDPDNIFPVL